MQEDAPTSTPLTLEVVTWFQVHRDRDEHCCELTLKTEQFVASCTGYNEGNDFTRKLTEFALMLIEFEADSIECPTFGVDEGVAEYDSSFRVRIVHAGEDVASLEFSARIWHVNCDPIMGSTLVEEVEKAWTFHVEIPTGDVRRMGYALISSVGEQSGHFSFELKPVAPSLCRDPGEPWEDGLIP